MLFSVGDRVRLAAHVGGYEGFVHEIVGGPDDVLYRVQGSFEDHERAPRTVAAADIDAGPLPSPTYAVGQTVSIYDQSGTVTADNGGGSFDVEVDWQVNEHMTLTRLHRVPAWQIAIWNEVE